MFFNPLFMQSTPEMPLGKTEQGSQTFGKLNKLSNAKYLFSDIIKVFNESDQVAPNPVLPESTNLSTGTELFAFQSIDISAAANDVNIKKSTTSENSIENEISNLINSLFIKNESEIEPLNEVVGSKLLTKQTAAEETAHPFNSKEVVVKPEKLAEIIDAFLALNSNVNSTNNNDLSSPKFILNENENAAVSAEDVLHELETKGIALLEITNGEQSFQFSITKVDVPSQTTKVPLTTASTLDAVSEAAVEVDPPQKELITTPLEKPEARSSETVKQSAKNEVISHEVVTATDVTEKPSVKKEKVFTESELLQNKVKTQTEKSATPQVNAKIKSGKNEIHPNNEESLPKMGETEVNKVVDSKTNLMPDEAILPAKVEPVVVKNSEYKIVVQAAKILSKSNVEQSEVTVTAKPESQNVSVRLSAVKGGVQPVIENLLQTHSLKTLNENVKPEVIRLSTSNELLYSPKLTVEGNKINVATQEAKVEPADIKLLKILAHTKDSLNAFSNQDADKAKTALHSKILFGDTEQLAVKEVTPASFQKEVSSDAPVHSTEQVEVAASKPVHEHVSIKTSQPNPNIIKQIKDDGQPVQTKIQAPDNLAEVKNVKPEQTAGGVSMINAEFIVKSKKGNEVQTTSGEDQKVSAQKEIEKTVVKTSLLDNGTNTNASEKEQQNGELVFANQAKDSSTKATHEVDETKPFEIQNSTLNTHQSTEIKNVSPKEKISSGDFKLPETEKTIKSFELGKEISKIFESGTSQKVVLRLLPEALGKVKLTLEVGGEIIHAKAEVETESVKQAIQTSTETLKQTLSQSGLHLASFTVSLSGSDEKQQKANAQKKKPHNYTSKTKIENQTLPEAARKLGYNTYEYLA